MGFSYTLSWRSQWWDLTIRYSDFYAKAMSKTDRVNPSLSQFGQVGGVGDTSNHRDLTNEVPKKSSKLVEVNPLLKYCNVQLPLQTNYKHLSVYSPKRWTLISCSGTELLTSSFLFWSLSIKWTHVCKILLSYPSGIPFHMSDNAVRKSVRVKLFLYFSFFSLEILCRMWEDFSSVKFLNKRD